MNENILHTRKATVFVYFYELVNYVFMIFCFGRVVSCVAIHSIKFSAKPSIPYNEFTGKDS